MLRTTQITSLLSYDDLLGLGVIPDLHSYVMDNPDAIKAKRYPKFVYDSGNDFSFYGVFMDYLVRACIRCQSGQPIFLGEDPVLEILSELQPEHMCELVNTIEKYNTTTNMNDIASTSLSLSSVLHNKSPYQYKTLLPHIGTLVNMMKGLISSWKLYSDQLYGTVKFNQEYKCEAFSGHPDVVTDISVLDIKNSASFSKMSKKASLQVLAYYALIKPVNNDLTYVGFILPMQQQVCIFDISDWDYTSYLRILSAAVPQIMISRIASMIEVSRPQNNCFSTLGHHITKQKNLGDGIRKFITESNGLPCQMYLANRASGARSAATPRQVEEIGPFIRNSGASYFTHAPHVINLCADARDKDTDEPWQQRILNEELHYTRIMGGKGVVVHTGARKNKSEDDALNTMELMVRNSLLYASEDCPLLLETPCGEGTEVVTTLHELGMFFRRFNAEEHDRLGLCVDTCHVFAAGYDPLEYLQHWERYCHTPIRLVHFNDSLTKCGSRVDRHATPGKGHIGLEKMALVANWCNQRNIPMIRES